MKRMNHKVYLLMTFVGVAALLAASGTWPAPAAAVAPAAAPKKITAIKVDAVAADPAAAYWTKAPAVSVKTAAVEKGKPAGPDVRVQAVYDGKNMALRIEWADTTNSLDQKMWEWDGAKFKRLAGLGDRMAVLFPVENNGKFATQGCGAACHSSDPDEKKWAMASDSADLHYDLWQWTSASTNPVGQAQDMIKGIQKDAANVESGKAGDVLEKGGSLSNVNKAKDGPAFMHGTDLKASVIISGQQVTIDTSKLAKGAKIPGSALAPWAGSRGDVTAKGVWKGGKWAVVLMRALDTGHPDDLVMTPPKAYPLGVAVFDHVDHENHTTSADVLVLEWK